MMTYPLSYHQQLFKAKEAEKLTLQETSKRFGVTARTLHHWCKRLEPKKKRKKSATKMDMQKLKKDVQAHPDRYHTKGRNGFR